MEFTINNNQYAGGKLSAFDQLHVARRVAPVLGVFASVSGAGTEDLNLQPLLRALAEMKDEDVEFVCNKCLEAVERKQAGVWAPLRRDGITRFELELPELLQITAKVIQANLENFTAALPSISGLTEQLKARA